MKLFVCIALLAVGSAFAEELTAESKTVIAKIQELGKQEEALLETLSGEQSDAVEHTLQVADEKAIAEIEKEAETEVAATRVKRGAGKRSRAVRARRARRARNLRRHRQNVRLRNVRRQRNLRQHRLNVRARNYRRQRNIRNHRNIVKARRG